MHIHCPFIWHKGGGLQALPLTERVAAQILLTMVQIQNAIMEEELCEQRFMAVSQKWDTVVRLLD